MAESLLDKEFLERLEYLYIVIRSLFVGRVAAERVSKKFGIGIEFADYRAYTPGDDYRYIDWGTYARRDELLIKLFTEEQSTHLYFVLDASNSMSVGSPSKLLFAKKVAAALAYVGLANSNPVTIVSFDARMRPDARNFQGRGQSRSMMAHLEGIEARGNSTGMGDAVREFVRRYQHRGLVVVLSDFLNRQGYEDAIRLLYYHRYAFIAVQVNDHEDLQPSLTGDVELEDSETNERRVIKLTPDLVAAYKQRVADHYSELLRLCQLMHRGHVQAFCDMPFEELIFDVFRRGGFLR